MTFEDSTISDKNDFSSSTIEDKNNFCTSTIAAENDFCTSTITENLQRTSYWSIHTGEVVTEETETSFSFESKW